MFHILFDIDGIVFINLVKRRRKINSKWTYWPIHRNASYREKTSNQNITKHRLRSHLHKHTQAIHFDVPIRSDVTFNSNNITCSVCDDIISIQTKRINDFFQFSMTEFVVFCVRSSASVENKFYLRHVRNSERAVNTVESIVCECSEIHNSFDLNKERENHSIKFHGRNCANVFCRNLVQFLPSYLSLLPLCHKCLYNESILCLLSKNS